MVSLDDVAENLLHGPSLVDPVYHHQSISKLTETLTSDSSHPAQSRPASEYKPLHTYDLDKARSYKQQYGDMYFLRLTKIKPAVEEAASAAWDGTVIAGEEAKRVERVLDVRQGELCWVVGTVFVAMPLKPDILEDVSKDVSLSASPSLVCRRWEAATGKLTWLPAVDICSGHARKILLKHRRERNYARRRLRPYPTLRRSP